jgi:hypothetical protein
MLMRPAGDLKAAGGPHASKYVKLNATGGLLPTGCHEGFETRHMKEIR